MTKGKKIAIGVTAGVLALIIVCSVVLYFVAVSIYDGSFNYRCTTPEEDAFDISEFPGMVRERHTFKSNNGQTLVGYLYESSDEWADVKGVIVFAHGMGGGGQTGYMDIFDIMVGRGYCVFAYDATANDESEGDVMGGLPQGFIDLDYAIDYAMGLDELSELPLLLMGYSWGGLSVGNVLNYHPEAVAAVSLAGWNESMNLIDYRGCQMVGGVAKLLLPFASLYEWFKYGEYSSSTAMSGFANTDARIMIVHGEKDDTIPIYYGYDMYYEEYGEDERFVFKKYDDRTHDLLVDKDGELDAELFSEIADFFDESVG